MPSYKSNNEELPSLEATLTSGTSLFDHLEWQLKLIRLPAARRTASAMLIIGNLDADGYLKEPPLDELAEEAERRPSSCAEAVLERDPEFDPVGVGARSLAECLLIQARHIGADDDVVRRDHHRAPRQPREEELPGDRADLKQPVEEIYEAAKVIMDFDPQARAAQYIVRGAALHHARRLHPQGRRQVLRRAERRRPAQAQDLRLLPDRAGRRRRRRASTSRTSCAAAQWLIRSIQQRQRTIVKVTESILKFQREFFDKGIAHLKPLILRDVAEDIGMHESTVSRVTTNKYVHTPQGIFELKFFFNSGIARTDGDDLASRGGEAQDQADHRRRGPASTRTRIRRSSSCSRSRTSTSPAAPSPSTASSSASLSASKRKQVVLRLVESRRLSTRRTQRPEERRCSSR